MAHISSNHFQLSSYLNQDSNFKEVYLPPSLHRSLAHTLARGQQAFQMTSPLRLLYSKREGIDIKQMKPMDVHYR